MDIVRRTFDWPSYTCQKEQIDSFGRVIGLQLVGGTTMSVAPEAYEVGVPGVHPTLYRNDPIEPRSANHRENTQKTITADYSIWKGFIDLCEYIAQWWINRSSKGPRRDRLRNSTKDNNSEFALSIKKQVKWVTSTRPASLSLAFRHALEDSKYAQTLCSLVDYYVVLEYYFVS